MKKIELIAAIAEKAGITKKDAEKVLGAVIETITGAIAADDKVQINGFGTFEAKHREARMGHNPRTGEAVEIAANTVPVFKPGKALRDAVAK